MLDSLTLGVNSLKTPITLRVKLPKNQLMLRLPYGKENRAFKVEKYVHSYPNCWQNGQAHPLLSARFLVHQSDRCERQNGRQQQQN